MITKENSTKLRPAEGPLTSLTSRDSPKSQVTTKEKILSTQTIVNTTIRPMDNEKEETTARTEQ